MPQEPYLERFSRFWEIDFLRGLAVIAMIVFHFLFDLNLFASYSFDLHSGLWFLVGRFAAFTFIFLVGLSLTISYSKAKQQLPREKLFAKYLWRGLRIFFLGMLITIFTFLFFPQATIWFGVLHLIGFSIILACFFIPFKRLNLFFAFAFILAGLFISTVRFDWPWLLWLGFYPSGLYTFDYYPLLPWFGIVLLGLYAGKSLYPKAQRTQKPGDLSGTQPIKALCFLGRHALVIYFLHQPILVALLYLFML